MRRRLLLVHPPFYRLHQPDWSLNELPLGLGYLAGMVRKEGRWDVRIYNADFASPEGRAPDHRTLFARGHRRYRASLESPVHPVWREIRRVVVAERPTVVGLSVTSPLLSSARRVARIARDVLPGVRIVMGGAHASLVPEATLQQCPEVDACVVGEGEQTLCELLRAIENQGNLADVAGLVWRDGDTIQRNPARPLLDELGGLPFPAQAAGEVLLDFESFPRRAFASMITSRGCPFGCAYCGCDAIWTRRVRRRPIPDLVAEVRMLERKLGVRDLRVLDDTLTLDGDELRALCGVLDASRTTFSAQLHPSVVDDKRLGLLARSGCHTISLGLESGSDAILARVRPGTTVAQGERAAAVVKRHGLRLLCYYLVGLPGESPATLGETGRLMMRVKADLNVVSAFTPYPGTDLFDSIPADRLEGIELLSHTSPTRSFSTELGHAQLRRGIGRLGEIADRLNRRGRLRYFSRHPGRLVSRLSESGPRRGPRGRQS